MHKVGKKGTGPRYQLGQGARLVAATANTTTAALTATAAQDAKTAC